MYERLPVPRIGEEQEPSQQCANFVLQTEGNKDLEEIGRKAISVIARERKSNYLNNWLSGNETNDTSMNVDEALRLLGVEAALETVDATLWPQIFAGARESKPSEQTEQAISAVHKALAGPSATVNTGHPPESWPVGLVSHGNTCYLNSLLQYYFSLKPLRDIVTDYNHYKMDTTESQEKLERVGQRRVSTQEIQGGQKFADELRHLFERMVKDRGPAVKPEQDLVCRAFLDPKDFAQLEEQRKQGESAIDDSAVQPDAPTSGTGTERKKSDAGESRASSETLQAEEIVSTEDVKMNDSEMPPTPPASPGQKAVDQSNAPPPLPARRFSTTTSDTLRQAQAKATQQQDVTEVHDSITQRLRAGMQPTGADNRGEQNDALRDLFAIGMSQTTLSAVPSSSSSSKPERISDSSIQLNVPTEPTTLYSALDDYFDPQVVTEGSEKQQYRSIVELPPLIQINMPRIGFSKERGAFKSEMALRLEDELYLDRYCEGAQANVLDKRRSAWGWRKQLLELKKEQKALTSTKVGLDGPTAVLETAKYLQELDEVNKELWALEEEEIEGASTLTNALKSDAASQRERLAALGGEVQKLQDKLTGTFDEFKEKKYRLYAVFFHRGGPSSGHYWVSIHDFKNDVWRNYNDESVTEVPTSQLQEIFYADKWQHGTPTFAVYVRDDLKGDYVQAVCREPEEAAEGPMPDLEMLDAPPNGTSAGPATVNPIELVKEGGGSSWDEERQVPDVKWG
jgi:ubiquitin carboxyl-terminal hydrolase 25/28